MGGKERKGHTGGAHLRAKKRGGVAKKGKAGGGLLLARKACLLHTSDAADDRLCVDLGGRRIIKKKKKHTNTLRSAPSHLK